MEPIVREMRLTIKHVGRGARLGKNLTLDEAREAMEMIVAGQADAYQVGAFLLAMRMKGESAEELAGFALGLRCAVEPPVASTGAAVTIDVDLHGDGREGRPTVSLAAACVAAACGARVLLRGAFGSAFARNDVGEAFARLGVDPARGPEAAQRGLDEVGVAVVDLVDYAPRVARLLALRERLGVRTCVNSAVKLLDPAGTRRLLVGIFHSPYHAPVAGAARLLGAVRSAVVQAAGGLPELAPDRPTRVTLVDGGDQPGPVQSMGGGGPALEPAEDASALAGLLEVVLREPSRAPPGARRMTLATAGLMMWAAGLPEAPVEEALASGAAARVLDALRLCYR